MWDSTRGRRKRRGKRSIGKKKINKKGEEDWGKKRCLGPVMIIPSAHRRGQILISFLLRLLLLLLLLWLFSSSSFFSIKILGLFFPLRRKRRRRIEGGDRLSHPGPNEFVCAVGRFGSSAAHTHTQSIIHTARAHTFGTTIV